MAQKTPIPNAMTPQQTARLVVQRLQAIQSMRAELELVQLANDDADTDPVVGVPKVGPTGSILVEDGDPVWMTYGERFAETDAALARVWKHAQTQNVDGLVEKILAAEVAAAEVDAAG